MGVNWLPAAEQAARDRGLTPDGLKTLILDALGQGLTFSSNRPRGRKRLFVTTADGRRVEVEYVSAPSGTPGDIWIQAVAIDPDEL